MSSRVLKISSLASLAPLASLVLLATACGQREEGALIDARDNVLEQGVIDCTERSDTGYSQGDSFAITVVTVDGKPVEVATADAYYTMQEAAAQDGVGIRIVSGFRTMEQQEYLYGCYVNCNCNSCNLAASPGYSNHQSGHALDLNTSDSGVLTWLNNHGAAYGFERTVPSEAWHWEWWGGGPGGGPCANADPIGYLDDVNCDAGAVGWAQDPDQPDAALEIHAYIDGPAGSGARGIGGIIAGNHRDDLCAAIGSCAHGYAWTLPPSLRDGVEHTVHAYAINADGGHNPLLTNAPRSFTCEPLQPFVKPDAGGVKRHVTSPDVLAAWNLTFDDVTMLPQDIVDSYETVDVWAGAPRLVQAVGDARVFIVDHDEAGVESLRHVPNVEALAAWRFDVALIESISAEQLSQLDEGPSLLGAPFLFRGDGVEVYMLDAREIAPVVEEPAATPETPVSATGDLANHAPFAPSVESGGCSSTSKESNATFAFSVLALFGMRRVIVRGSVRRRARLVRSVSARITRIARLATLLVFASMGAASLSCVQEVENGADGIEPVDERDNELLQGLYDCSESNSTGYRSGNSFSIKVVTVDGRKAELKTANAYIAMQAKAKQAGINIRIVSGFRTMAEQQYLYGCYVNCNCNSCNLAASPGYSNHQSGHALDLNTSDAGVLSWLNSHGDEYGFARTVPSEAWHWEFWNARTFDGPCGGPQLPPECTSGNYDGAYCDDDGSGSEDAHNTLKNELGVSFACADVAGEPAFCGSKEVTRAQSIYVLGKAADIPLAGHPNAFPDDNGHARENYMNAAAAFNIFTASTGNPDGKASRSVLAVMLKRMYLLPPADRDYFDDDDDNANEDAHNRVAAAGLFGGYTDNNGGRKDFKPTVKATKSTLAILAVRAAEKGLIPVWDIPQVCIDGDFSGHFCDDDSNLAAQATYDRLIDEAALPGMYCSELAGSPRFCASKEASRAMSLLILAGSAGIPLDGHPNGFNDDNDHPREAYFDAAKAYGIVGGYNGGTEMRPSVIATRDTLAIILARMYALPETSVDYFSDDNGSASEQWHNKVGAAGLFTGYDDGNGGKKFKGDGKATKGQLATLAQRAKDAGLVPVWVVPDPVAPPVDPAAAGDEEAPADDIGTVDDEEDTTQSVEPEETPDDEQPIDAGEEPALAVDDELEGPPDGLEPTLPPSVEGAGCSGVTSTGAAPLMALLSLLPFLGVVVGARRGNGRRA